MYSANFSVRTGNPKYYEPAYVWFVLSHGYAGMDGWMDGWLVGWLDGLLVGFDGQKAE